MLLYRCKLFLCSCPRFGYLSSVVRAAGCLSADFKAITNSQLFSKQHFYSLLIFQPKFHLSVMFLPQVICPLLFQLQVVPVLLFPVISCPNSNFVQLNFIFVIFPVKLKLQQVVSLISPQQSESVDKIVCTKFDRPHSWKFTLRRGFNIYINIYIYTVHPVRLLPEGQRRGYEKQCQKRHNICVVCWEGGL